MVTAILSNRGVVITTRLTKWRIVPVELESDFCLDVSNKEEI